MLTLNKNLNFRESLFTYWLYMYGEGISQNIYGYD